MELKKAGNLASLSVGCWVGQ
jgi:hypothetical protein